MMIHIVVGYTSYNVKSLEDNFELQVFGIGVRDPRPENMQGPEFLELGSSLPPSLVLLW